MLYFLLIAIGYFLLLCFMQGFLQSALSWTMAALIYFLSVSAQLLFGYFLSQFFSSGEKAKAWYLLVFFITGLLILAVQPVLSLLMVDDVKGAETDSAFQINGTATPKPKPSPQSTTQDKILIALQFIYPPYSFYVYFRGYSNLRQEEYDQQQTFPFEEYISNERAIYLSFLANVIHVLLFGLLISVSESTIPMRLIQKFSKKPTASNEMSDASVGEERKAVSDAMEMLKKKKFQGRILETDDSAESESEDDEEEQVGAFPALLVENLTAGDEAFGTPRIRNFSIRWV